MSFVCCSFRLVSAVHVLESKVVFLKFGNGGVIYALGPLSMCVCALRTCIMALYMSLNSWSGMSVGMLLLEPCWGGSSAGVGTAGGGVEGAAGGVSGGVCTAGCSLCVVTLDILAALAWTPSVE